MRPHRFVSLPKGVLARAAVGFITAMFLFVVWGPGAPSVKADQPPQYFVDETKLPFDVPFSMEQIYARRAGANGVSDRLVTRAIRDVNHCGFNTTEMERGFADLVSWVSNGVKPAGDDILTPAVVANPNFGCNFTVGSHFLAPVCQ